VRVLHVCEVHHPLPPTVVGDSPKEAQALVDGVVAELQQAGVTCEGVVRPIASASPASTILQEARDADASMIMLGSRGRSDLGGLLLDSVADKVIQLSTCPVLVVRDEQSSTPWPWPTMPASPCGGAVGTAGPAAGWAAPGPGVAGRHPGRGQAVEQAMGWFAGSGVAIVSLHVFDVATGPRFWDRPEHDHAAWSRESSWPPTPRQPGRHLEVRSGWPSDRILEVAGTERADMIAFGWRRRLVPDRAAVVPNVLARSPVPVILVPHAA
jgi:nucleotide-binding universal stress UspA family protein